MRLFRRGPAEPEIGDFWTWWPGNHHRIAAAITARAFDDGLVEDMSGAVRTIHPGMAWELGPGRTAEHAFWAADIPDSIGQGGPARRIKVDFGTDVDWSFQKTLGVR
jgi:hypothetical protein